MGFFNKSAKLIKNQSPNSLLATLESIKNQMNPNEYSQLVKQIHIIENNLNYFKKKYLDFNTRLNQFEMSYVQALKNIKKTSKSISYPDELNDILNELERLFLDNHSELEQLASISMFGIGFGLIAGIGSLEPLIAGIAFTAANPVGAIIIGAIFLTLAVCLLVLGIVCAVHYFSKAEQIDKLDEIRTIINQPLIITPREGELDDIMLDEYSEQASCDYSY